MAENTANYVNILNDIENTVSNMSFDELELLAKETDETLHALMNELKKRKDAKMHEDVDHLDEHLKNADTSFQSLRKFIAMAIKEIRS